MGRALPLEAVKVSFPCEEITGAPKPFVSGRVSGA